MLCTQDNWPQLVSALDRGIEAFRPTTWGQNDKLALAQTGCKLITGKWKFVDAVKFN